MKLLFSLISLFVAGCSTLGFNGSSGYRGGPVKYSDFQKILNAGSPSLMPGGKEMIAVMALPGDTHSKLYRISPNKRTPQLEFDFGRSLSYARWDFSQKNLYLMIDNKGDENTGIYRYNFSTQKAEPIFVKEGFSVGLVTTSPEGDILYFNSNHLNKAVYSGFQFNVVTQELKQLTPKDLSMYLTDVTLSGQFAVASRQKGNGHSELYWFDLKKGIKKVLFSVKAEEFAVGHLSEDGQSLMGTTSYKSDRQYCAQMSVKKPNVVKPLLKDDSMDVSCYFSRKTKIYQVFKSYDGKTDFEAYRQPFSDPISLPKIYPNQNFSILFYDQQSQTALAKVSSAQVPGEFRTFRLGQESSEIMFELNKSQFKSTDLAQSFDFRFKARDGLDIHGIIYAKKEWLDGAKKYPLIVWPHGGPDASEQHVYHPIFQYLVLNGFVVFAPNYRGSTGYGKRFETLNDKDWGGKHINDLIDGKNQVVQLRYVDSTNVFIFGGSFGGYSSLAAITFHPQEFRAASAVVAIGNLFTFLKSIPPDEAWQSEFITEVGHPVRNEKLVRERSPFFHVERVKTPVAIYQAENDVRTVLAEMDAYVAELKKQNKEHTYTVLKDVGHNIFGRPEAAETTLDGTVEFFRSHMSKQP